MCILNFFLHFEIFLENIFRLFLSLVTSNKTEHYSQNKNSTLTYSLGSGYLSTIWSNPPAQSPYFRFLSLSPRSSSSQDIKLLFLNELPSLFWEDKFVNLFSLGTHLFACPNEAPCSGGSGSLLGFFTVFFTV